jgi:hypothetical protein
MPTVPIRLLPMDYLLGNNQTTYLTNQQALSKRKYYFRGLALGY